MPPGPESLVGTAPATVAELLARFGDESPPIGTAGAAVTVLLRDGEREVETLLIERTERPTDPASGQVAFPGGRVEESDSSLRKTALRELEEEVGLAEGDLAGPLRYVGTEHAARFRIRIGVFAGALSPRGGSPTALSAVEVAHIFWLPRSELGHTQSVHRETGLGLRPVPATVYQGHILWGFTRRVIRQFYGLPTEDPLGGPAFAPDPSRHRGADPDASRREG